MKGLKFRLVKKSIDGWNSTIGFNEIEILDVRLSTIETKEIEIEDKKINIQIYSYILDCIGDDKEFFFQSLDEFEDEIAYGIYELVRKEKMNDNFINKKISHMSEELHVILSEYIINENCEVEAFWSLFVVIEHLLHSGFSEEEVSDMINKSKYAALHDFKKYKI